MYSRSRWTVKRCWAIWTFDCHQLFSPFVLLFWPEVSKGKTKNLVIFLIQILRELRQLLICFREHLPSMVTSQEQGPGKRLHLLKRKPMSFSLFWGGFCQHLSLLKSKFDHMCLVIVSWQTVLAFWKSLYFRAPSSLVLVLDYPSVAPTNYQPCILCWTFLSSYFVLKCLSNIEVWTF